MTDKQIEMLVNCGAIGYTAAQVAKLFAWDEEKTEKDLKNKKSDIYKYYQKGKAEADFAIDSKLFEMARGGDLQALDKLSIRKASSTNPQYKRRKVSDEAISQALHDCYGNLTNAAILLKIDRTTIYDRLQVNPEMQRELDAIRESRNDRVESVLMSKVLNGSSPELIFFTKTQLRGRGYVEKITIEHTVDGFISAFKSLSPEHQLTLVERLEKEAETYWAN